jgi:hypothetical protein
VTFLEANELTRWCRERDVAVLEDQRPLDVATLVKRGRVPFTFSVHSSSARPQFVRACLDALGEWDECLLWITQTGVWPSSEDWPAFYALRGQLGEKRSVEIAPGQLFSRNEEATLECFVVAVVANAWDAYILPVAGDLPTDRRLFLSHDEWAEVESVGPVALTV